MPHTHRAPTVTDLLRDRTPLIKFLIVEDSDYFRTLLERALPPFLKGYRCEIRTATGGKEGLKIARGFCPDIVITDIEMSGGNGIEFCRCLRSMNCLKNVKIVCVSGYLDETTESEMKRLHADACIKKPARLAHITTTIRNILMAFCPIKPLFADVHG